MRLMGAQQGYTNLSHLLCGTDGPISITQQFVQVFKVKYLSRRGLLFQRIKLHDNPQKSPPINATFFHVDSRCPLDYCIGKMCVNLNTYRINTAMLSRSPEYYVKRFS